MKGKDIQIEIPEETAEGKAKKVITRIHGIIAERKEELKVAEDKLAEVLDKDIELIEEKDGQSWDWD